MVSSGDNRRRFRRSRVSVIMKIAKSHSELIQIKAITRDLSLGGACIELEQSMPSYSSVRVYFYSEFEEVLDLDARVLWVKEEKNDAGEVKFVAGLQFLNLHTKNAKEIIDKMMKRKSGHR